MGRIRSFDLNEYNADGEEINIQDTREDREATASPAEILGRLYLMFKAAYDKDEELGSNLVCYAVMLGDRAELIRILVERCTLPCNLWIGGSIKRSLAYLAIVVYG